MMQCAWIAMLDAAPPITPLILMLPLLQAAQALQQGNAPGQKGRTPPASFQAAQQQSHRGQSQQYAQPQANHPQSQYPARAQEHSEFPPVPKW